MTILESGEGKRVVCFGELLIRLAAPGRELLLQSPKLDVHVGGAEANVAVALARLGHKTMMVSTVPDNALGDAAAGHLRRYGVSTEGVTTGHGRMGLYFLSPGAGLRPSEIVYDREESAFALASDYHWPTLLHGADMLHLSGITPALGEPPMKAMLKALGEARAAGIKVSFDGNYRASLWRRRGAVPRDLLGQMVGAADIFFGNHRDISLLLGSEFSGDGPDRRREAAEAAFRRFPNLGMIASTARHAEDSDRHRIAARIDTHENSVQTEEVAVSGIVDRIGAGDAFAAGVIHGIRLGRDLEWTVHSGLALSCLKHSLPGDSSLFGPADIEAFMAGERDVRR